MSNLPLYQVVHSVLTYDDTVPAQSRTSQREPILETISRTRRSGQLPTMWLGQVLQQKIKEQLHVIPSDDEQDTWILVIYGLGGLGKSQLALNFVHADENTHIHILDRGQSERNDRARLSVNVSTLVGPSVGGKSHKVEEVVVMAKSWFHRRKGLM